MLKRERNTYLHFTVDSVASADSTSRTRPIVTPIGSPLPVGTVASEMARVTADATDDACSEVLALGTVVLAVTDFTTVLASLVLVVTEGTVKGGQLA